MLSFNNYYNKKHNNPRQSIAESLYTVQKFLGLVVPILNAFNEVIILVFVLIKARQRASR